MDKGVWRVSETPMGRRFAVYSSDFTHDVQLAISGDFADIEERRAYANWLAESLTKLCSEDPSR